MTTDTIKITMDLLYRKYLIPMLLFDENGYLIHPKNLEDLPITISTYFPFRKTEQIQLYHTKGISDDHWPLRYYRFKRNLLFFYGT